MIRTHSLFTVCLLVISLGIAKAQVLVTPTVTQNGSVYTYDYLLFNNGSTSIIGFSLAVPVSVTSIDAPNGWTVGQAVVGTDTLIQWVSTDIPFDLQSAGTLSGFRVLANASPGNVDYSALDENFTDFPGQTSGPVILTPNVPEPGAVVLMMSAGLSGAGLLLRRRLK